MTEHVIKLTVNGIENTVETESNKTLLWVLRNKLKLIGTKTACERGDCGLCTVLLDDTPVKSCLVLAVEANGHKITTIEGIAKEGVLSPIQRKFIELGAIQCGFCTPGMVLSAKALLDENPKPSEEEIRSGIAGNLCRCTGYLQIVQAIKAVSEQT